MHVQSLRVLHVNHTGSVSGAEHALARLLDGQRGVDAHVACPDGPAVGLFGVHAERHRVSPVRLTMRLRVRHAPRAAVSLVRAAIELRRLVARVAPDVVHANSIRAALACALVPRRTPVVLHVRDAFPAGRVGVIVATFLRRRVHAVVAVSDWARGLIPLDDVTVVPDCVDTHRYRTDILPAADLVRPGEGPTLGVVAQITPWKGQDVAIAATAELRRRGRPGATLLIIGHVAFADAGTTLDNRGYERDLVRQADRLGVADAVRFVGQRDDIPEVMRALDVLLVPSWAEPFGLVVIEGMACGTPVVATDVGGPATTIDDGRTGYLAPARDVDAWVREVERALDGGRDAVAAAPVVVAERFAPARHAAAMREVFVRAIVAARGQRAAR